MKKTKSGFSQPFQHLSLFLTHAKKKKKKKRPYILVMKAPAMTEEGDGVPTKMKSKLRAESSFTELSPGPPA